MPSYNGMKTSSTHVNIGMATGFVFRSITAFKARRGRAWARGEFTPPRFDVWARLWIRWRKPSVK